MGIDEAPHYWLHARGERWCFLAVVECMGDPAFASLLSESIGRVLAMMPTNLNSRGAKMQKFT